MTWTNVVSIIQFYGFTQFKFTQNYTVSLQYKFTGKDLEKPSFYE